MIGISQQQQTINNSAVSKNQHSPAATNSQKEFSILRKVRSQLSFQNYQKGSSIRKNQRQQENEEESKIDEDSRHKSAPLSLAPLTLVGEGGDDEEVVQVAARRMKKSVSFSSFNSMKRVPSVVDLLETSKKDEILFERTDFSCFAQEDMSRRFSLGITSTSALDSSVPEDADDDDSDSDDSSTDDENGMTF